MNNSVLKFALIALVASFAVVAGCQTASMLSKKVEGSWSGNATRFSKKTDINGEFTPTFRFIRNGGTNGGELELTAQIAVMMPVNAPIDSIGTSAVSATAAGLATVRGSWIASDDDEIDLRFDLSTLVIDMDPDVQFELANIWTSSDVPTERTVSDAVKKAFVKQMTDAMTYTLMRLDDLDDVSIKDNLMSAKFLGQKQTLTRIFN
ncbi:MAG: hypothetical protein NC301_06320 [Bacteroides sp.]|nr:hypothetical protein [Bacteroides sp.]MCM1378892.1 hypothetical protein [Bacteroides sp.]MCM1445508.1 hypothetical protein [Prevotella sp.]